MSKQAALDMLSGTTTQTATPGLITQQMPSAAAEETGAAPVVAETPKTDELQSQRLAILAKKEAALFKEREALKKKEEEIASSKTKYEEYVKRVTDFDELAKKDKIQALRMLGWSDADIINSLNQEESKGPSPEEIARKVAQEEAQKVRDELKRKDDNALKSRNDRLVKNLKTEIMTTIKSESEKYEYCNYEGAEAEALAYEFIVEDLKTNQNSAEIPMLTIQQALQMAEEYYENKDKAMSGIKKRAPKPADSAPEPIRPASTGNQPSRAPISNVPQKSKTLTNEVTATVAASSNLIPKRETPSEKKERLIKALINGGLNR